MNELANAPDLEQAQADAREHFWPHGLAHGNVGSTTGVQVVTRGDGVWVIDGNGERWFDTLSGLWLVNIGHGRREIADAVYRQMLELSFSPNDTVSPVTAALSRRIAALSQDPAARVYFTSGGSEANETALKLARNYHHLNGEPSRWKILSRRGSYHGATLACTSLGRGGPGGASVPKHFGPLVPGNIHVDQPAPFHCHLCRSSASGCTLECARDVERAILHEGPSTVAAFIGEPISAAAGIHVPDPGYWPAVREICDRHGVLLIADEVITGFCRTGRMFAMEHWGVKPDIFTVAKALTSGYLPIGAAVATGRVADRFGSGEEAFQHLLTFGGNPASCAAALANLDIMESEGLVERSREMGGYLLERMRELDRFRIVGEVRGGLGLFCAVELVCDRQTRAPFPKDFDLAGRATRLMREHRLLGRAGSVIPVAPPLCITREEIDEAVERLGGVIGSLEKELAEG